MTKYTFIKKVNSNQKKYLDLFKNDKAFQYIKRNCILCNNNSFKTLYKNDRYNIKVNTVMCNKCGLVFTNPMLDPNSQNIFYTSGYYRNIYSTKNNWEENVKDELMFNLKKKPVINKPNFNKYYDLLFFDYINNLELDFNSVFEVGAKVGLNLIYFKNINKYVEGSEPNISSRKIAKEFNINLFDNFENTKNKYDLVILRHVLEHMYDPISELKKVNSLSNKYVFIEVPGFINRVPSIQNAHNFYFSKKSLEKTVNLAGLKIIDLQICSVNDYIFALCQKENSKINELNQVSKFHSEKDKFNVAKIYYLQKIKYYIKKIFFSA